MRISLWEYLIDIGHKNDNTNRITNTHMQTMRPQMDTTGHTITNHVPKMQITLLEQNTQEGLEKMNSQKTVSNRQLTQGISENHIINQEQNAQKLLRIKAGYNQHASPLHLYTTTVNP